ncbi:2,3-bisphosphoglycerate-independent phosphoglycerate mutase [Patescibacteria group bacterium]|nr:MAG: 2,3-bisphosphoglycerate-independent phosphoglycerate mutase [Patescibacteria group bacterium]
MPRVQKRPKPVVLVILDGWGTAPATEGNALSRANLPNWRRFLQTYPAMNITASSSEVGLSWGEMGNSEVGHLNIGAGRVYYQTLPRIAKSIEDGTFYENAVFKKTAQHVLKHKSKLHLVGLVSRGNVHSSLEHLFALLEFCRREKLKSVFVQAILDGRDSLFNSGLDFVTQLQAEMKRLHVSEVASLSGRFFAMDRDNRWDRTEQAWRAMAEGTAEFSADDPLAAIKDSYGRKVYDEEFAPTVIKSRGKPRATLGAGDAVLFFNFRPDRLRQLTRAFALPAFERFKRNIPAELLVVTMTEYEKNLPVLTAYPPEVVRLPLAKVIADAGLRQLHIAETEKYAHVTFFLNGTIEEPFPGEDRVIIPSPRVSSYAQKPEMSARELTERVVKEIDGKKYDFIAVNFANSDMVGHTGNLAATIQAAEVVDECLGKIAAAALRSDGVVLITADHGNSEEVINLQTGEIDKEHSTNPVPLIVVGKSFEGQATPELVAVEGDLALLPPVGMLADVAPTVLSVMDIDQPAEMTGRALV